ncbi:MAG TPA: nucleoside triphosphate pyrophosphohydrolase [Nitriliruptorales bacterium]|nr:nucleoside triphosphate pyrophosphohydrolase [Nitriliruptorales bacterium]
MTVPTTAARVVLVAFSERLPDLFPLQSWEALSRARTVWTRDPDAHPSGPYLALGDIPLARLEPARLDIAGLDLTQPGSPQDRRYARALLGRATAWGEAVYLLGPTDTDASTRTVAHEAARAGVEVEYVFHHEPPGSEVLRLAEVERTLRHPETGCPWDLQQDHASLGHHLLEETYELLDAIAVADDAAIAEELGDVLLQVVFHAQIASDRAAFDLDDVARGITDKLVRRHPHVFAGVEVSGADEVVANWEVLKQQEKRRTGPFDGVPSALPALALTHALQRRAARLGFDQHDPDDLRDRIRQQLDALDDAAGGDDRAEQLGDLLATVVALARHLRVDPEQTLRAAAVRFRRHFEAVLAAAHRAGIHPDDLDPDAWLRLWHDVEPAEP